MLTDFIKSIFETGELKVEKEITSFTESDTEISIELLHHYFDLYKVQFPMPHKISFHKNAAFWAASYLYRLCQAMVLRDLSEKEVQEMLPPYTIGRSVDEVLSIDLLFQSIPQIFKVSKKLSPQDILNTILKKLAQEWPLSLLEISDTQDTSYIENNPALLAIYSTRIIEKKYHKAITSQKIKAQLLEQLGDHQPHFWDDLKALLHDR